MFMAASEKSIYPLPLSHVLELLVSKPYTTHYCQKIINVSLSLFLSLVMSSSVKYSDDMVSIKLSHVCCFNKYLQGNSLFYREQY